MQLFRDNLMQNFCPIVLCAFFCATSLTSCKISDRHILSIMRLPLNKFMLNLKHTLMQSFLFQTMKYLQLCGGSCKNLAELVALMPYAGFLAGQFQNFYPKTKYQLCNGCGLCPAKLWTTFMDEIVLKVGRGKFCAKFMQRMFQTAHSMQLSLIFTQSHVFFRKYFWTILPSGPHPKKLCSALWNNSVQNSIWCRLFSHAKILPGTVASRT